MYLVHNPRLVGSSFIALVGLLILTATFGRSTSGSYAMGSYATVVGQKSVLTEPVPTPAAGPTMVESYAVGSEVMICCDEPCIVYRGDRPRLWRRYDSCQAPVSTILLVQDPRGCCDCCEQCAIEVPVCVPTCCLQEPPSVKSRCGLFGRGIVTYDYCCGFRITVIFRNRGDVLVRYSG